MVRDGFGRDCPATAAGAMPRQSARLLTTAPRSTRSISCPGIVGRAEVRGGDSSLPWWSWLKGLSADPALLSTRLDVGRNVCGERNAPVDARLYNAVEQYFGGGRGTVVEPSLPRFQRLTKHTKCGGC